MSTSTVSKTPQKETHTEQEKREALAEKVELARQGQLPDNADLTSGLSKAQAGITKNDDQLSATGRAVTKDINNILETVKTVVNEKNDGNLLQKAYYHTNQAGGKMSFSDRIAHLRGTAQGSGNGQQVRDEARQNVSSMATIAKLAFLSPEFRATLNDLAQISSQVLKNREEAHHEKTGHVPPHSDSNEGSRDAHAHAAPVANPAVGETTTSAGVIHAPGSFVSHVPLAVVPGAVETTRAVDAGAHPESGAHHESSSHGSSSSSSGGKKLTREEKEDKLIDRLVDLAQTLHSNPEYRNSINYIASSVEKLKSKAADVKQETSAARSQAHATEPREEIQHHRKEAGLNTKEFVENWIGDDYNLDRLLDQVQYLHQSSTNDPELRSLLADWKKWSTQSVNDSAYVQDKERVRKDVKDLIERTRALSNGKYKEQFAILRREVTYINRAIQRDDTVQKLRDDISQLGRDLFMDQNGRAVVKPELLGDAQKIIVGVLEAIKYIPLPPIYKNDENMELQLENIVLTATEIIPSNVRFIVEADAEKTGATQSRQNDNAFIIEVSKIRAHLTSINFFVDKKTGFPKITERGLADIDLQGTNGMSLRIAIAPKVQKTGNAVASMFEAKDVNCSISKLRIHLRDTKHDFLYRLVGPVLNMAAKKRIETGVQDAIRDAINKMNDAVSSGATNTSVKAQQKVNESDKIQTGTHTAGHAPVPAAGPVAPGAPGPVPADAAAGTVGATHPPTAATATTTAATTHTTTH